MSLDPEELAALTGLLQATSEVAEITEVNQLTGGASRQTYAVDAVSRNGDPVGYILQREMSDEPRLAGGMADEADLVAAAHRAGVPTPAVIATNRDGGAGLGGSFFVAERVAGETIARRVLREDRFAAARRALPAQLGRALATLHTSVDPAEVTWLEASDELARYREVADELDLVSPAFELAFRWLEANRPVPVGPPAVVHGDFRLGNLIVDADGLASVLDWELGHLGDPMEDLGWLCVRAWRFGGPAPVAGVGDYEDLWSAYEEESGQPVDREAVRWWETLGTLKWGVMCGTQSNRHLSGTVSSVELVAIGPRVAEQEYDVLRLIHPGCDRHPGLLGAGGSLDGDRSGAPAGTATGLGEGGGRPSAGQLVDAVRQFLLGDVSDSVEGRTRFHALVAANALAIVGRDLDAAEELRARGRERLARLGFGSERQLAAAIRAGDLEDRIDDVAPLVMASVVDRLAVNNPKWLIEPS